MDLTIDVLRERLRMLDADRATLQGNLLRLEGARNFCLAMIHDLESKQDAPTDGAPAVTLLPKQD